MALPSFINNLPKPYTPPTVTNYPVEYFSGVDTSIFFDGNFVDEITDFTFSLEEYMMPLYGYAGYTASTIVHGTRLIQGSFRINMRAGDYLHEMMWGDIAQGQSGIASILGAHGNVVAASDSTYTMAANSTTFSAVVSGGNPFDNPDQFSEWTTAQQSVFWNSLNISQQSVNLSRQPYFGFGGFTILLVYGDIDTIDITRNVGRVRTIDNVHICSARQIIAPDGEAISEIWRFIATDMNAENRLGTFDGFVQSPYII